MAMTKPATTKTADENGLVEMAWDPITRIVGSLGIYTKIDFGKGNGRGVPQHLVDLPRLQHLHEGQGPARRPLHHQPHLRDLRRQPRHLLVLRPEHGLRRPATGPRRVDRQPRRGRRVHVRPQHLPGEPGRGRLLREDGGRDQSRASSNRPTAPRRRTSPTTATAPSATSCGRSTRSRASSTAKRSRSAAVHARDVLPDGGTPRASRRPSIRAASAPRPRSSCSPTTSPDSMRYVEFMKKVVPMHDDLFDFFYEALPGYEEIGRRRILLGCWGAFQDPDVCNFDYKDMDGMGPGHVRHARRRGRRQARHQRPRRHQPRHPHPARLVVLRRLGGPGDVRHARPARQPGRPPPPLEPAHQPPAPEARLRRQVQLGDVASLVRRNRPPRARHRWRTDRPAVVDGACRAWSTPTTSRPPATAWRSTSPRRRSRVRSPWSGRFPSTRTPSSAIGPARTSRPTPRPRPCTSPRSHSRRSGPGTPRPGRSSRFPTRRSAAGSPRRSAASCRITW